MEAGGNGLHGRPVVNTTAEVTDSAVVFTPTQPMEAEIVLERTINILHVGEDMKIMTNYYE